MYNNNFLKWYRRRSSIQHCLLCILYLSSSYALAINTHESAVHNDEAPCTISIQLFILIVSTRFYFCQRNSPENNINDMNNMINVIEYLRKITSKCRFLCIDDSLILIIQIKIKSEAIQTQHLNKLE